MAPSRRRGASKAAAAVAACSKWKIGDLVLAKVKGFPAWPARVSEPMNWGFKQDLKKVFVYFFGTEQIAFCAPADIESFTEEKKTSLLAKRHGKGTDFARAVKEIIDSHDESKKNEQIVADFTNEIAETNNNLSDSVPDNKMAGSIHNSRKKEEVVSSVLSPELKIAESIDDDSDFTSLADAAVSELEKDNLHGNKMLAEEPSLNVVVTYSSRRKDQPARRSRSSRVDASRVENFMTPQVDSNGDMVSNISRDRTGKRSKRLRRSSPASNSNGSIDENGADTAPNSDCFGFSDEIVVDSVIFRKKRKPNRKRSGNETIEFTAGLDKVENFDSDLSINDHLSKENGDKHLPLVKRARVRFGASPLHQIPSAGEQSDSRVADKMLGISNEISIALNCEENDYANGNLSPLNISSSKSLESREVNKTQPFSSLVDGEAALPPSKRLHRALEAMSANAAEEGQTSFDGPAVNINTTRVGGEVGSSDDAPKLDPAISEETVKTSKELDNGDQVIDESCNDPIDAVESREFKHHGASSYKNDAEDAKQDLNVSSVSRASVEPEPQSVDMSLDGASREGSSPASLQHDTTSQFNEDPMELPEAPLDDGKLNYTMDDSSKKEAAERSPKAIATTFQEEHVSHSNSISNDLLMEKAVSTTHSSSSVTDGLDSGRRISPLFSSASNLVLPNKTDTAVVNNGCCSPEGDLSVDRQNNAGSKAGSGDPLESFESVLGTLTRSRESITRATHIAIDCAKIGSASKVVEIITCNLENETSLLKKVDLLFLVDSITQCSRGMKDSVGEAYLEAIQKVLSRLVPAAAPPGTSAQDNRRQCLKVLRVWLEKRVFPESIVRHHIRELDALCCSSSAGISSRSLKTERAFDDPIRQMEGMMVDEYGSNSSIQLPGFSMPPMLTDAEAGTDSDEDNFEAVTPEHNTEYREGSRVSAIEKHPHILEDVDGELEMEDLAPSCDADSSSICLVNSVHSIPPVPVESPLLPPPPPPPHAPTRMPDWHTHPHGSSYDSRNEGFHLHPPHPPPSNHFSYPYLDQRMPSRRDPHRYPMAHCSEDDRFFRDRARMKHAPRDVDDCWRSPAPPFSGSCHPDFPRRPHGHVPYSGPPREPAYPNQRWYNPGDRNHREYIPHRPPPGGPIPVSSRGSNYWRPR